MLLRPYQDIGLAEIHAAWMSGHRNVLFVSPTGSGKTIIFSEAIRLHTGASVAIAHRQELVSQISMALARDGVRHRVLAPTTLIKWLVQLHIQELGRDFYDPSAHCAVAGVDTLVSWSKPTSPQYEGLRRWAPQVTRWIMDECFPAGTIVDGRPIETLVVGDIVTAYNEKTDRFEHRKITRLFKNKSPENMMRIDTLVHHVLYCTKGHPFLTKRGWIPAVQLTTDDEVLVYENPRNNLHCLRNNRRSIGSSSVAVEKNRTSLLREKMFGYLSGKSIFRDNEQNKPDVCVGQNEEKKPNVQGRESFENGGNSSENKTRAENQRWKRKTTNTSGVDIARFVFGSWFSKPIVDPNRVQNWKRLLSPLLQSRHRSPFIENSYRSRRFEPLFEESSNTRSEEGRVSYWTRVDGVAILEQGDNSVAPNCCPDGFVYNIEVEGLHTYVANSIVVHNCHHILRDNKWGTAVDLFPQASGLGVTATPGRTDGKGLGRYADGVFDHMIIGPGMRDLIHQGYLTDYRVFCPPSDLDLTSVATGSDGDYIRGQLALKTQRSSVMGDVVAHYLRWASGKLGITFAPDVETATDLSARFNAAGVRAEVVSAKTPDRLRQEILRKFRARKIQQLVNVDLFGEGFDLPAIEVVSMARATQSFGLYVQQFGRGLRLMDGKSRAIIIDHVGNVARHGLPDRPRVWTLDRRDRKASSKDVGVIPIRTCLNPLCLAPYEAFHPACPFCGWVPVPAARTAPEFVDGDLCELDDATLAALRGEIIAADRSPETIVNMMQRAGHPYPVAKGAANRHAERQSAQAVLRDSISWFGGVQRAMGRDDRMGWRAFYHMFGVDVLSAQALGRADAEELTVRINAAIGRTGATA